MREWFFWGKSGMKCPLEFDQSAELVIGYGAGTLDPDATAAFERHIGCCPACSEAVALQKAVWAALDEWREVARLAGFRPKGVPANLPDGHGSWPARPISVEHLPPQYFLNWAARELRGFGRACPSDPEWSEQNSGYRKAPATSRWRGMPVSAPPANRRMACVEARRNEP